jgi:hypothetical protein
MSLHVGDKVKFLNEAGGGIVIKLINEKQALVQIEDGFEIPCSINDLIKTESSGENQVKAATQPPKPVAQTAPPKQKPEAKTEKTSAKPEPLRLVSAVKPLLAFIPKNDNLDAEKAVFDMYLLNDGDYFLYYTVAFERFERLQLIEKGELEPEMKVNIGEFTYDELKSENSIIIDFLAYNENEYKHQLPINQKINLKTINILKRPNYKENDFFYENAYIIDLSVFGEHNIKEIEIKDKKLIQPEKPKKTEDDTEVVDLHIEEIVDDISSLTPGEILNTQMARFTTTLEGAIRNKTKKIVFIHGVGNGKLRYEIQKTLNTKYPDLKYQDASFAEYGYGATMVLIR